jgi:hypothetical protein
MGSSWTRRLGTKRLLFSTREAAERRHGEGVEIEKHRRLLKNIEN